MITLWDSLRNSSKLAIVVLTDALTHLRGSVLHYAKGNHPYMPSAKWLVLMRVMLEMIGLLDPN